MLTITAHLQSLSVYVPPSVTKLAFENPSQKLGGTWRRFYAATAFADISGFTPLAEALASGGARGAEELTSVLNQVFEALITTVEFHGGQVFKFGGDALSLMWPCEPDTRAETIWQAVQAAFAMQAAMARFAIVTTSRGEFELRMKIGLSVGEVLEVHAGGVYSRLEYVLAGAPLANMSSAENLAEAGQIVIDQAGWELIQSQNPYSYQSEFTTHTSYVQGDEIRPGFYRVTDFWGGLPPKALILPNWSSLDATAIPKVSALLRHYIPGAISSLLESGHNDNLAELKPLTICFVSFDGIDYINDPEAGPRLSNFMLDAQEIIYRYQGSVNKLAVGDKGSVLLVLFGAPPFFHEDDEIRAVACALGICKVAARHQFKVQVGLAAGLVFAGPLGAPQRQEYSVIGDTVNLAARLMSKADPNEVWVDQSVQSKASRFFEYDDLGFVQVKGKIEPRHVYRAIREKELDQQDEAARYLLTELTGRTEELKVVDTIADKVWAGQGQVLLLSGEAGIGKSRLAGEIARRWLERGGVPHTGDCFSHGRHTPYLPWRSILSSIAGLSPRLSIQERLTRLKNLLHQLPSPASSLKLYPGQQATLIEDYWLERLPLIAGILGLETEETTLTQTMSDDLRRDNVFATIRAILIQEAKQRPTLVLLEDTHWSDELSLELAVHLAAAIADQPLFLVLVHRPPGQPVPIPYQRLQALPYISQMLVNELDAEASLKLAQNKLGVKNLPPALADLICRKGQGNPFFIEELINSLLGMEALKVANGICLLNGDLTQIEMPDTVQKVVLARIDGLKAEEEKMTLKVAAVFGRTFQQDLLKEVHPWIMTEADLQKHLAHLQAQDFTQQEVTENGLLSSFKHVITQEVAYETMLHSQRQQLHAKIGRALEERYSQNDTEIIHLLVYHYTRSNDRPKALNYLQRAGQKALDDYANEAAISYFSDALAVAKEVKNVKVQYDLLAGRERAYNRLGNRMAQVEDLAYMKGLALAQNNLIQQLEASDRSLQLATNLGDYHEAVSTGREALALAHRAGEAIWEARILTSMGITYWRQGDYDQAQESMLQALKSEGANNDQSLKATCLNYLGLIHTQISEYEQAYRDFQQAIDLYREIGDKGGEGGCANNLGLLEASLGRYEQAEQYYSQALSICHITGDRLREGISLNTLGQVHVILGNHSLAKEQLTRSLSIRQTIGDRRGEAFCLHDLGYLHLATGQTDEAINYFHTAATLRHELGESGNYVASLAAKGEACLAQGDRVAAYQSLQEAIEQLRRGSGSGEYPTQNLWWTYSQICRVRHQFHEADQALRRAYELVKAKADQISTPDLRRTYLENVRANAAIMAEMAKINIS